MALTSCLVPHSFKLTACMRSSGHTWKTVNMSSYLSGMFCQFRFSEGFPVQSEWEREREKEKDCFYSEVGTGKCLSLIITIFYDTWPRVLPDLASCLWCIAEKHFSHLKEIAQQRRRKRRHLKISVYLTTLQWFNPQPAGTYVKVYSRRNIAVLQLYVHELDEDRPACMQSDFWQLCFQQWFTIRPGDCKGLTA